tara:strand:+ start:605 stop:1075 length:471 start_codon:yes stop_codon:yes gene_type:complete
MGINNSKWYVYSRDAYSNTWNRDPLQTFGQLDLGYFKHMVYKFALQEEYSANKALYLYNGSSRLIKAEVLKPTMDEYYQLFIEFKDESLANRWDSTPEKSNALFCKEFKFKKHYVPLESDHRWVRRWQIVTPMPDSRPGLQKLSLTEYITSSLYSK